MSNPPYLRYTMQKKSAVRLYDTIAAVPGIISAGELADLNHGLSMPNGSLPKRQSGRVKAKKGKPTGKKK